MPAKSTKACCDCGQLFEFTYASALRCPACRSGNTEAAKARQREYYYKRQAKAGKTVKRHAERAPLVQHESPLPIASSYQFSDLFYAKEENRRTLRHAALARGIRLTPSELDQLTNRVNYDFWSSNKPLAG